MSQLSTQYEVKNGKLVPKRNPQPTKKDEQGKPAAGSSSQSSGYGDEKK